MNLGLHKKHLVHTTEVSDEVKRIISLGQPQTELKVGKAINTGINTGGRRELRWKPEFDDLRSFGNSGRVNVVEKSRNSRHIGSLGGGETLYYFREEMTSVTKGSSVIGIRVLCVQFSPITN